MTPPIDPPPPPARPPLDLTPYGRALLGLPQVAPAFGPLDRGRPRDFDPGSKPAAPSGLDPAAVALLAYVTGYADELAGLGVVMGSKVAEELVAGVRGVVAGVADRRAEPTAADVMARVAVGEARNGRGTMAGAMLPLTVDTGPPVPVVVDALGVTWESPADALRGGVLGLCGCGSSEQIGADLAFLLTGIRAGEPAPALDSQADSGELYREVLLHLLTDAELLEHGTSVAGSWRTELGDRWAEALR